jgi:HK97 family phage major capsid protein
MDHETIKTELKATENTIRTLLTAQNDEIKKAGETSAATAKALADAERKYDEAVSALEGKARELEAKLGRIGLSGEQIEQLKSAGQRFIDSPELKAFAEGRSSSAKVEVKALTSDAASVGRLIQPTRVGEIMRPQLRPDHVRDLLNIGRTGSNSIEFPRETLFTNNAAPVAEGALKSESNLTFDVATAPIRTLAHWVPITKQARDDLPMIQSYVDGRLTEGLYLKEDAQLLYGDGTGQNLLGLIPQATAYNRATTGTRIDIIRRARTQVRLAEYQADGVILNPVDWEEIELAKGTDGHYLWVNVTTGGEQRLWRMPIIETTAINEGDFLVGAFGMAAQIWLREDVTVEISEHDRDNFIRNMLTLRAEERLGLTVYRPQSFVRGDFTP